MKVGRASGGVGIYALRPYTVLRSLLYVTRSEHSSDYGGHSERSHRERTAFDWRRSIMRQVTKYADGRRDT